MVQQARLAWDRLRHVLDLELAGPRATLPVTRAPLTIRVTNRGSGHKFPTGFPEGRVAWLAVRAFDLGSGRELEIHDTAWNRTSVGVGGLTAATMVDPNVPGCDWKLPAGSPDPYAVQFKAVATLGDGCPTLELAYAHAPNLIVNAAGQPIDDRGRVIDRSNPKGQPQYQDRDGDGDVYDDAFLSDTRLDPLPRRGATSRPRPLFRGDSGGCRGPGCRDGRRLLPVDRGDGCGEAPRQPCRYRPRLPPRAVRARRTVRRARAFCRSPRWSRGRRPSRWKCATGSSASANRAEAATSSLSIYPAPDAVDVYRDVVVKATFSEPVIGVDATTFTLRDSRGAVVPASVDQIGDGTWALFPHRVFLKANERYSVRIDGRICGLDANCMPRRALVAVHDRRRRWTRVMAIRGYPSDSPGVGADTKTSSRRRNR